MNKENLKKNFDFAGWVTKNNVRCSDGRTILDGAFAHQDGAIVPLVWNHQHESASDIGGKVLLENRKGGIYGYAKVNGTKTGQDFKELVHSGDITAFSIYAGHVKERNGDVMHGDIMEVSLVLAGANPEAKIETFFAHGSDGDVDMLFVLAEDDTEFEFSHSDKDDDEDEDENLPENDEDEDEDPEDDDDEKGEKKVVVKHADEGSEKTVQDVVDSMNDDQKNVMYALIGAAVEEAKGNNDDDEDEEEDDTVRHNAFEGNDTNEERSFFAHSDIKEVVEAAKRTNTSLKENVKQYAFAHSLDTTGLIGPSEATANQGYGVRDLDMIFPDYHNVTNRPEFISRNMSWVDKVLGAVHRVPYKRIQSVFADITENEARAKGFLKGNVKTDEVFTLLKRKTEPHTIYKRQKFDRDDILDAEDWDVIAWIKEEMTVMLNEEKARAILIGDGRPGSSNDKIDEQHIRPVVKDVPLFNVKVNVTVAANVTEEEQAIATVKAIKRARKEYKGSGNPTFYTTEDVLTEMLLIEDKMGNEKYKSIAELATALRVSDIVTVEPMEGATVDNKPLIGTIVNLADYYCGGDTARDQGLFEDFDIDYNRQVYLRETRMSGALVKPFSALTILLNKPSGAEEQTEQPAG